MASFSLRSQRTGNYKEFSLLEVLKLLGDQVNDEIWLEDGEDVYNLSSFKEINSGGVNNGNGINWSVEDILPVNGLDTFYMKYQPANTMVLIILNGMLVSRSGEGREVKFPFTLNTQDTLRFIYQF